MILRDPYTDALLEAADALMHAENAYCEGPMRADDNDWTTAFLRRMTAHAHLNRTIKLYAHKHVSGAMDHAMVETLAMLLKAYLLAAGRSDLSVASEKTIHRKGVRPDVSVWQSGVEAPVAVIEAKVQMGWGRSNVAEGFRQREADLVAAGVPHGNIWHVVGTQSNWTRGAEIEWGSKWRVTVEGPWNGKRLHPLDPIFVTIANLPKNTQEPA